MANTAKVAISTDFLSAFAVLPKKIQGKVTEFVNKFRNNPKAPGINYEKLGGIDDKIHSVRIDDAYRGIVVRQEETGVYLLLWVDHHDEAYAWAKRKRCEVNPQTGAVQVFDVQQVEEKVKKSVKLLFADVSDSDLIKLSLPEIQLPFARSLETKEQFFDAEKVFPHDAFENLTWIVEGFPVNEVLEMVAENTASTVKSDSLATALETPESQKSFVIVDGEDELRRIMAEPLEKWRVFLHPSQRKVVQKNFSGPARVLGGAGTGKTVVAMHRAKYLASKLGDKDRILFTTFTANLANDIKENLRKICSVEEMRRIEVINFDALVSQYLREQGFSAVVKYGEDIQKLWSEAVAEASENLDFDVDFFEEEWNRVAIANEALTVEKYVKAPRVGRGTRLDRKKRLAIWKVFECYINLMRENHVRDANMAMYECSLLLQKNKKAKYAHIIVDEAQDFSDNAFRLIRSFAGEERENDIFIVGDSHQRIYKNKPMLSRCGINIRGRSSYLKVNYRTTEEIRKYAFALLNGISFDDLDDSFDVGDKCRSLTHGTAPVIQNFKDFDNEFDFIINEIKRLNNEGETLSSICIVARTQKYVDMYSDALNAAGMKVYAIKRNKSDDRSNDGIRVATMHRVKGLEFKYVFVAAINNGVMPLKSAIKNTDEISKQESLTSEKCLLYVAMTRAQKGAYITSYGKKSEFIG
ncbi:MULTISPECIES: UvrD-helicase domain-containing protein [unclassified Fibrobacter]|uniref:UvrD-helicase domain-containing protein n=1 Tax=unclassified Fibrobacter TaxID=2634177 RepID=UPI0025BB76D4|nr:MULTISPECIES: UvrD-helicase domain-containing protein [unclassified Fibrobacter]